MGNDDNMTEQPAPELYPPRPLTAPPLLALPVVLVIGLACLTGGYLTNSVMTDRPPVATQLGNGIVTFVDPNDKTGVAAAIAKLKLPQRQEIELAVSTGKKQMGWIFFGDSMDPDGDVIAVEAGGIRQEVLLANAWTPVAVPLSLGEKVGIVAVRDGGGGGVTVTYATRNGQIGFPVMSPGQRIEIDP
jgi:hypothetical protein